MKLPSQFKQWIRLAILLLLAYLLPKVMIFYLACGVIDVCRNYPLNAQLLHKYFLASGMITWALSPLNLLVDLLTLSWRGVYTINDLPKECRQELQNFLEQVNADQLIAALHKDIGDSERGMMFYKWYGQNMDHEVLPHGFHQRYRYIKTIGVSVFNRNCSTSRHFGPLRLTVRALYNLRPIQHNGVYIEASGHKHYWHDNPLFIFDDTRIHQSFNQADQVRYCLFIDVLRPSKGFHGLLNGMLTGVQKLMANGQFLFYKKWKNLRESRKTV